MTKVKYETQNQVAIITLDNPPLNTFGYEQRGELATFIDKAVADNQIKAIVITGSEKVFSSGADVTEFANNKVGIPPDLRDLISIAEECSKPTIAAISGTCMGGAFEFAMGCHYRIAKPDASLALPEIKIGIFPGAGGTQRLPRLIGIEKSFNIIMTGNTVSAEQLKDTELFDSIIEGDLIKGAVAFATDIIKKGSPIKKVRDIKIKDPEAEAFLGLAETIIKNTVKNYPAPLIALESLKHSLTKPIDEALMLDRQALISLFFSPEATSLIHLFFAERTASKIPDIPEDTPLRKVEKVAVIGAGTMGGGITMAFANAGYPVTLVDSTQEALDRGTAIIQKTYIGSLQKGKVTMAELEHIKTLIKPTLSFDDLKDADLIIEAVFEDMKIKEDVFKKLDTIAKPGAILASNTSTLDLNKIASFTKRPGDVVGMHFFAPANIMKLLEIVRGKETAKDVLASVMNVSKKIKKVGIVSGVCDGFIGNRMLLKYIAETSKLVAEGASPQQIDKTLEKWGMVMGPFRVQDLSGLDVGYYIRKRLYEQFPQMKHDIIADKLVELKRLGQKTGAGWYRYEPGVRDPIPDPVVGKVIEEGRKELGITPRKISDQEIIERCLFPLINEGAKILEEGIALRASDIDIAYIYGYGFPPFRGGPMCYANWVTPYTIVRKMKQYANQPGADPKFWEVSPLLMKLAQEGKNFN